MSLSSNSPILFRVFAYLNERFPPLVYTVLVLLFWASSVAVTDSLSRTPFSWDSALVMPVVWLVFLHLRLFDEHKDADIDRMAYPERLLSRGVVTLHLLRNLALMCIFIECVLSYCLGLTVLIAWALTFTFTLAMRFEFGVGEWLNSRMLLYAVTHNPVVALLGLLCWASTGNGLQLEYGLYLCMVSLSSLVFELGRKIRLPEEEMSGVPSYSSTLGRTRAIQTLRGVALLSVLVGFSVLWTMCIQKDNVIFGVGAFIHCCAFVVLVVFSRQDSKASKVETAGSVFLLLQLVACIVGSMCE